MQVGEQSTVTVTLVGAVTPERLMALWIQHLRKRDYQKNLMRERRKNGKAEGV
jgi:hypothetical protein